MRATGANVPSPSSATLQTRVEARNSQASALVRLGLAVISTGDADAASRALACFDRALDIRRQLPTESAPLLQYDLAGTWLNRAEALAGLGGRDHLTDAMHALDEAVALLERLPLSLDPRFSRRLAIAYLNRGVGRRTDGARAAGRSVLDFIQAIGVLEHDQCAGLPDRPLLLAACWVNLADAQASEHVEGAWRRAVGSTVHAKSLVARFESSDVAAAEIGVRARHVCCRALARCASRSIARGTVDADVHAATDAVDEALDLIRQWERRGVTRFRSMANDFFRFGLGVYTRVQPHFVAEFVSDQRGMRECLAGTT
jgi:hypothetical protein